MHHERLRSKWPVISLGWKRLIVALGIIFSAEYALMLLLPKHLPVGAVIELGAAIDAVLLTVVAIPTLWWAMILPMQQASRQRDLFLSDIFDVIEDERRRIAHELHDGVGQTLSMLVAGLRSQEFKDEGTAVTRSGMDLSQLAQRALADTKQIARGLRPSLLDDLGLAAAIERIAAEVALQHHLRMTVNVESISRERLPDPLETRLFRVFQECLANVVQHSKGTDVIVRIERIPHEVQMTIQDNGQGFDPHAVAIKANGSRHLGLAGMRERVALLGGKFEVESIPGAGTSIMVTLPL